MMDYTDQTPPPSFKWFELACVFFALLAFAAFAAAESGYFPQPESARAERVEQMQAEPAAETELSEPPAVPSIWEIMQSDNQAAAEFCGARKGYK